MPFATTNFAPATNARVTVKFAGLLLLRPNGNTCEVGVHNLTTTHLFQVILVVQKPQRPPTLVRLLTGPLTAPLSITVAPAPLSGFSAFAGDSFDLGSQTNHELDYRWAVNLRELHEDASLNEGAFPAVTLNAGVLYASTLSQSLELSRGNSTKPRQPMAADLAVAIDLPSGSNIKLNWSESKELPIFQLPRLNDPPGTIYTISLINDPPLSSPAIHDELDLYYDVLDAGGALGARPIPESERWKLVIPQDPHAPPRTDEIPCLPVILNP